MPAIRVEVMDWAKAQPIAAQIRFAAFLEPDALPGVEVDEQDAQAAHAIAYDEAGKAVGTGRLLPDGQIGQLIVLKAWRRQGVGAKLLNALLAEATKRGCAVVTLTAPLQAAEFYREQGFTADGKVFKQGRFLQQKMRKSL